jgi:glucose-6-phosphate isomerase
MLYRQITDACFSGAIGAGGLDDEAYSDLAAEAQAAMAEIGVEAKNGGLRALSLAWESDDLAAFAELAGALRARFDALVVLGTGGSSLGAQAVTALAPNGLAGERYGPAEDLVLHFVDNLDGQSFGALLAGINMERTAFLGVSKSGGTAETLSQLLSVLDVAGKALGKARLKDHVYLIAEPGGNGLRALAKKYSLSVLDHPADVGGRFSVLSLVGVLPALAAGLDAEALRGGAAQVLDEAIAGSEPSAPARGAALAVGLARSCGLTSSVMMPYANRLGPFASWYCQLWAESLGKDGQGTTPIKATGPVDQHSQLQLYLAGPADKMFTTFSIKEAGGNAIDGDLARLAGAGYLAGRTMGEVVDALHRATAETLARNGRPVRVFELDRLDEEVLGGLFMHFMLETLIAARLMGVDALGQPAVEEGKVLARSLLADGMK